MEAALVAAVLGTEDAGGAAEILAAARALGVDPLDHCAHRFGLGHETVMARAAAWAGFAFYPAIPEALAGPPDIARLDELAGVASVRARVLDREVIFCAPRFAQLVALAARRAETPDLARRLCLTTGPAIRAHLALGAAPQLMDEARQRLSRRWPRASAHLGLTLPVRIGAVIVLLALLLAVAIAPHWYQPLLLPVALPVLVVPALLRLGALGALPPILPKGEVWTLRDEELPVYSILIPLRDEAHMVPLLVRAMRGLDYPPEKLDIKFVVEERSAETVAAVRAALADPRFELVVVPDAAPRTKPKALNYALPLVRGRYLVVFDAEDIPERDQLRRAAQLFFLRPDIACIQAELVIENAGESPLARLFAGEYAGLFGFFLPALAQWRLPTPLGGTSNHLRSDLMRALGGWDAFNVTEDADLGVRLARLGYGTAAISSRTYEEAPTTLDVWMAQRTRWMKGWLQTFIVHNLAPRALLADLGWRSFLFFQMVVGAMILAPLLHCVFLLTFAWRIVSGGGPVDFWTWAYLGILVLGYGAAIALTVAGLLRLGRPGLVPAQLLLPLYWLAHAMATLRAVRELLFNPFFWAKTRHGVTRQTRSFTHPERRQRRMAAAPGVIAGEAGE